MMNSPPSSSNCQATLSLNYIPCNRSWAGDNRSISLQGVYNQWSSLTHVHVSRLPSLASSIFLLGHCRVAVGVQLQSTTPIDAEPPSAFVLDLLTTLSNLCTLVVTAHEDVSVLL
ncbi:hypothetical protein K443DRAFT_254715 [Laccaria amethystina LaAM-08-1]|uniref:Uncharacterized protein n=1 Tax=Laccaria amethystina LaAM-08-1 TaxID=1095629 RepID=A0A0C9XMN5_9AGAR|nr:hypothetical protein K443DRAFT_254715 [Laccaria amethystina LaAM-08-1]